MPNRIPPGTPFAVARAAHEQLTAAHDAASAQMRQYPNDGPMGLTPSHIKSTPEWQRDYAAYQMAMNALRDFNATYTRMYKAELARERAKKREANPSAFDSASARLRRQFHNAFPEVLTQDVDRVSEAIALLDGKKPDIRTDAEACQYLQYQVVHGEYQAGDPVAGFWINEAEQEPEYRGGGQTAAAKRAGQVRRVLESGADNPQRVRFSGAEMDLAGWDGAVPIVRNDQGDEFPLGDNEPYTIIDVAEVKPLGAPTVSRERHIQSYVEDIKERRKRNLEEAMAAIERYAQGKTKLPVGISGAQWLASKGARGAVERKLLAAYNVAMQAYEANTVADERVAGAVWDRMRKGNPSNPPSFSHFKYRPAPHLYPSRYESVSADQLRALSHRSTARFRLTVRGGVFPVGGGVYRSQSEMLDAANKLRAKYPSEVIGVFLVNGSRPEVPEAIINMQVPVWRWGPEDPIDMPNPGSTLTAANPGGSEDYTPLPGDRPLSSLNFDPYMSSPWDITPPHSPTDPPYVRKLAAEMRESGWTGRPLVAYRASRSQGRGVVKWRAISGSHRIAAARAAGLERVPVVEIEKGAVRALGHDLTVDHMREVLPGRVPDSIFQLAIRNPNGLWGTLTGKPTSLLEALDVLDDVHDRYRKAVKRANAVSGSDQYAQAQAVERKLQLELNAAMADAREFDSGLTWANREERTRMARGQGQLGQSNPRKDLHRLPRQPRLTSEQLAALPPLAELKLGNRILRAIPGSPMQRKMQEELRKMQEARRAVERP